MSWKIVRVDTERERESVVGEVAHLSAAQSLAADLNEAATVGVRYEVREVQRG